jgi:hypothetical protein
MQLDSFILHFEEATVKQTRITKNRYQAIEKYQDLIPSLCLLNLCIKNSV